MTTETKIFGIALKDLILPVVVAVLLGLGSASLAAAKQYVDHQDEYLDAKFEKYLKVIQGPFLTIEEWKLASAESDERKLKSEIKFLQWKVDSGTATDEDKFWLQQKKNELDDIQADILKLITGRPVA